MIPQLSNNAAFRSNYNTDIAPRLDTSTENVTDVLPGIPYGLLPASGLRVLAAAGGAVAPWTPSSISASQAKKPYGATNTETTDGAANSARGTLDVP